MKNRNGIEFLKTSLRPLLLLTLVACGLHVELPLYAADDAADVSAIKPLVRVVDLTVGESTTVELCDGQKVDVKLLDLQETRDPIRQAVRSAIVTVQVDGETITIESGMYNLPQRVAGVQIDCSITSRNDGVTATTRLYVRVAGE
ncbi:MAG TPA: hypothetical protein PLY87_26005 [Planctomycetaceae bacterium]|nr:hypothetical protein [Planctomycetaceae bacterium]HQZ68581.1 hypothetical protein [Planctomycetaceae bacterium]